MLTVTRSLLTAEQPVGVDTPAGVHVDSPGLLELARHQSVAFAAAKPYPHLVLTGLIDPSLLREVAHEAAAVPDPLLTASRDRRVIKRETAEVARLGPVTSGLIAALDGPDFRAFLETLTGIEQVLCDPTHFAAGLHETGPGGYTLVHTDFRRHPQTRMHHRINVLIYLNEGWREEWGGSLELWPPDMSAAGVRVTPELGTVVVFATHMHTPHGLPDPIVCPPGQARRSLAVYYYTRRRPEWERTGGPIATYRRRPGDSRLVGLPTAKELAVALVPRRIRRLRD